METVAVFGLGYQYPLQIFNNFQDEVERCEKTICIFCSKVGAASGKFLLKLWTLLNYFHYQLINLHVTGCWKPFCPVNFHLPCSLGQAVVNRHDIYMSSCWAHSRRQVPGDGSGQAQVSGGDSGHSGQCGVCSWSVKCDTGSLAYLVSTCCGTVHHRDCIQVIQEYLF